jgi:hypothetical protein
MKHNIALFFAYGKVLRELPITTPPFLNFFLQMQEIGGINVYTLICWHRLVFYFIELRDEFFLFFWVKVDGESRCFTPCRAQNRSQS